MIHRHQFLAVSLLLTVPGLATADGGQTPEARSSVVSRAASTGQAALFVNSVVAADLVETLVAGGEFTVFVPTDDAFCKLPSTALEELLKPENKDRLARLLKCHALPGRNLASDLPKLRRPKSLAGPNLTFAANGHGLAVNEATVVKADIPARNGVVHLIDRVLMPPAADILEITGNAGKFNLLLKAIDVAGLTNALRTDGPFTVLAPTDEAFARLGKEAIVKLLLRLAAWSGWIASAAASIALASLATQSPEKSSVTPPVREAPVPLTISEQLARLRSELPHVALKTSGHPLARQAGGELFWDLTRQQGYMMLEGLAPVDPGKGVYQLWIFDARRDERYPVNGGVFAVEKSDAPALIPFRAPLPVDRPTLFAITLEPPGGVVVSDRQRIMLAAQ
jgi:uncharacterized surface protein with fasciclin (FAS1) repeats